MTEISIESYSPKYKDQVIDLLSILWSNFTLKEKRRRFEWRYEKNPYTESPLCYVALNEDKIVGFRAFVTQKFRFKGENYYFGTPADAVVHLEYRRQGIFSNLTKLAFEDVLEKDKLDYFLSLSSNEKSTKGNIKAGFRPFGQREKMYYISPFRLVKNRLKLNDLEIPISIEKKDFKIEITEELRVNRICSIIEETKNENQISNIRDEDFYSWRFSNPLKDYAFGYCTKKDELIGYIALDITDEKIISIMEYSYKDISYFQELLKTIINKLPVPIITAYVFTRLEEEKRTLSRCGFRYDTNWLIKLLKRMGYISSADLPGALIKPISEDIIESDFILNGKDVRDPDNWSLFKSDVH